EQQLGTDHVGHVVVDAADQEDHPLLQQARIDVVRALAAAGLFDHHRHEVEGLGLDAHWNPVSVGSVHACGAIASWKVSCLSVCSARSAIQSITCSSITRLCSPDISWGSLRYKSITCCGSS